MRRDRFHRSHFAREGQGLRGALIQCMVATCAVAVLACSDAAVPAPPPPPLGVPTLTPEQHLVRASVLLRGVRPSLADLERVAGDPDALPDIVDAYLGSDEFGAAIRRMHGEWLLTDTFKDYYPMSFPSVGALSYLENNALNVAIAEAPARLAERIVTRDLAYTELVTADYTMADSTVAAVWGLPYDEGRGGWQAVGFDDGRPAAGLLSDPWYFVRHASTPTNRQRARAAHISRALLCHDYMNREVRVPAGVDLTSGGANSLTENPVCVSCHATLDEFGAFFEGHEGVTVPEYTVSYPIETWTGGGDPSYPVPAFYGVPGDDLVDMGQLIADDPRFARCAIRRFYGQLMRIDEPDVPDAVEDRYLADFLASGMRVKRLLRRMVLSDEFAARGTDAPEFAHISGLRRVTPWHLARMIEDLTGVTWDTTIDYNFGGGALGQIALMDNITWGFRDLAGGADGMNRFEPMRTANPTTLLVLRGLAAQAAAQVVAADLSGDAPRLLTAGVTGTESAVRGQLVELHLRLYGERLSTDDPAIDAGWALFEAGGGLADIEDAWTLVVFAMLQDPRMLYI